MPVKDPYEYTHEKSKSQALAKKFLKNFYVTARISLHHQK